MTADEIDNFNPLPLYRGRLYAFVISLSPLHFNPLPLYRGRRWSTSALIVWWDISIHFLYTEEDVLFFRHVLHEFHFNPLPLYRGRRGCKTSGSKRIYFNPLPLYRGRLSGSGIVALPMIFQSTSSIQRKTPEHRENSGA